MAPAGPALLDPLALAAGPWSAYAELWLGYLLVAALPGPNMFLVAALAARRGLRGAGGLILSITAGGGALALLVCLVARTGLPARHLGPLFAHATPALLLLMAWQVARAAAWTGAAREPSPVAPPAGNPARRWRRPALALHLCGFATAFTNPVSAGFFLAHFARASRPDAVDGSALILAAGVMAIAAARLLLIALLLRPPPVRNLVLRHLRLIRHALGGTLVVLALSSAASLLPSLLP